MAGALSLTGLVKRFGDEVAVDGLDLEIGEGEFFSLLGSSGCGKTTTLRMIAGFEQPDDGQILLDGNDLAQVPPHKRPVNTVFQSYALFPFLDVHENVAFGLRYQRASKQDVRRRVGAALDLVQMGSMSKRKPHQLSGGQQQRVALARALVLEPTVLLLDEPMGALDAKLRKQLQVELRSLQKTVGTTFVYVTHDQDEALTMSDRLAVLDHGRLKQVGTPSEVYSAPANTHVATFLGTTNLWPATV
ncbi:MAG TPA: ATP-binding cassette domain-containing protein, partial [Nocardioides sp.]|nr:ATP-binding cassette domain-containing protein [Nocardioides sp.]